MASATFNIPYNSSTAESVISRSYSRWQAALHLAESMPNFPETSFNLKGILFRTPSLPETIPSDSTWIEGYSTWRNSDASCPQRRKTRTKTERVQRLFLRKRHPTICTLSTSHNFLVWKGAINNGIAILVLGWAYILSASLAERQNLQMEYAASPDKPLTLHRIDLDYATPQELTWWKAVLARGLVWSITGEQVMPWAVRVGDIGLDIVGGIDVHQRPPTAKQAARYLARLCHAYDLGTQCSAALAAALSLPLHASTSPFNPVTIELPPPSFITRFASPSYQDFPADFEFLGYYMAFSLCSRIYGACLWSIFWESEVSCNFAGAWLEPIATTLRPIICDNNLELLAKVLSFKNVAPLWLGLALCGHRAIIQSILPSLTELRDYPHRRPDVDSAAWAGEPQSFMDIHPAGPYLRDGLVSRADVWRLRHDFHMEYSDDGFSYTPPYGWPPFGKMRAEDVELEIRSHLYCSHQWKYAYWTWLPDKIRDVGFSIHGKRSSPPEQRYIKREGLQRSISQQAIYKISKLATEAVFWWCCNQVEKGFGRTLVPHRSGPDEMLGSAGSDHPVDYETIYTWLQTITVNGNGNADRD